MVAIVERLSAVDVEVADRATVEATVAAITTVTVTATVT